MSLKVRYQWTGDLREALALNVEKREKLWKKVPVVSHDNELRAKLWAEVAQELTHQFGILINTEDMKKTWKNLKDNYWRITRLYENDPLKPRRWRFYNCMKFMDRANIDETAPEDQPQDQSSSSDTPQTRLLELIEMANQNYEINDETRYTVQLCASTLRGVYHQAAFALFMRQNMPSGQLQTLVDAYDDFVYNHNTPMSKVVSKVVKGCEPDKQKAFSALFSILERNADMVSLKCPDDRWAEIDNEARKNIDRLFARGRGKKNAALSESQFEQAKNSMRKRKRHVLTELGAEEQKRFMRMRANIAKKLVEYVTAIESTKSLLDMVEPDDNETREELENTLRNVQEMHEKTKNDQQRLEAQYKEFRNRSYGPRKKKRYVQEKQSTTTEEAPVSTDNGTPEPEPKELFDSFVKVETQT
ncbi:hypothetical protein TELCIR_22584 [Teladorsagia circumcincta]|uniref:MADF domain-containing protein n=1 Tax=Teladorsagia circumcincta TaxID=45464 RepID=A0A2G9TEQ2_TELCI|nr:hypothetical protein TELCIR_22584 [Teladorsagia circumcincta]